MQDQQQRRTEIRSLLIRLLNEHPGCRLPVYDGQTIELTLIVISLMGENDFESARRIVYDATSRLNGALKRDNSLLPVDTDLLEDAIALTVTDQAESRDFFQTSSLVPALATLAALLNDEETLGHLRDDVHPLLQGVTLERWFPDASLETLTASQQRVQDVGVSRAVSAFRGSALEEREASLKLFEGGADPSDFKWHKTDWDILLVVSARLHRHPVPTWFLASYARDDGTVSAVTH
jgi:hypothetical protein